MQKIERKPKTVRELLIEMKDISDLVVDLAYASLLFESVELAKQVHELERRMDDLMYNIRVTATMAARNIREAEKITGILQIASAAEAISNATGDMADLVLRRMKIHPVICDALRKADEKVAEIEVSEGSILAGKKLGELKLTSSIGVWLLARKRGEKWTTPLPDDADLLAKDVLIAKGPMDGIATLRKMAGVWGKPPAIGEELPRIRDTLAKMRDLSWFVVDLAYMSVLLGSREVAEEVRELEEEFNKLKYKLWLDTLTAAARLESDVEGLNSVLQVGKCMEKISDAADSIADVVLRGLELHPVFAQAIAESDEQIARVDIPERSPFVGKTLEELNLWKRMGTYTLLIKRGKHYIFDPKKNTRIKKGDMLVVRGPSAGVEKLKSEAIKAR